MRFKLLACEIFRQEINVLLPGAPHPIDVEFLPMQLHTIGKVKMKKRLSEYLATVVEDNYDALLLAYGLCSGGIAGLAAGKIPLVVPRAHDCITLFLGSRQRYSDYFFANGGTYFMTAGWFEQENAMRYGPEMMPYYNKLAFIETLQSPQRNQGNDSLDQQAQQLAKERQWEYEKITGDLSLLQRLISGDWKDDFLIVPPGKQIRMAYDDEVIEVAP